MTPTLSKALVTVPIAHRGLHDASRLIPENSRAAMRAAIQAGYCIELDLQLSGDCQAIVFHDYHLDRLTGDTGLVRDHSAEELAQIALLNGDGEMIPSLAEILTLVAGRVPLLIELKDQDGGMGPDVGALEKATAQILAGYKGDVALMSFNPHSVAEISRLVPDRPRGIVTSKYDAAEWSLPVATCDRLREIPDFEAVGASFISHAASDLLRPRVQALRASGVAVLCWTVRSLKAEAEARKYADNVTFEGYYAEIPA